MNDRFFSVNDRFAARKTTPGKDPREHRKSILLLSILLPVYLAIAAGVGYLISSRVFSGVGNLSRTVAQIRTKDDVRSVRAVSTDIRELEPLTDGFNRMLARLHQSFEAEKHFTDNASYELKTPIAVTES